MDDHHLAWLALSELNLTFKQGFDLTQLYGHGPTILEQQGSPQLCSILNSTQSQGPAQLTSMPLQLSLATQPQQVLAELAPQLKPFVMRYQPQDHSMQEDSLDLAKELQILLGVFGYDPMPVDILCTQLAQPYNVGAAQLVELELLGLVRLTGGGYEKVL